VLLIGQRAEDGMEIRTTAASAGLDLLTLDRIGKSFAGVPVVLDVSLVVRAGTVLALVGENGAGKSTLMKIVAGVHPAGTYSGTVRLADQPVRFRSVAEARAHGVVLVPQELHIAPDLSVAENVFAGSLPARHGLVHRRALVEQASEWLRFFDLDVDPASPASVLSPAEQKLALIAGALSRRARVLVLDEPTASMSVAETGRLFGRVAALRAQGIGVVLITHRLDDVAAIADDVAVMRNGRLVSRHVGRVPPHAQIVREMIGRDVDQDRIAPPRQPDGAQHALRLRNLRAHDPLDPHRLRVDGVALSVHAGEIVGLFGLVGAGRTELARVVFGTWPGYWSGTVEVNGRVVRPHAPGEAIRHGIAMLTEDRKRSGIFEAHSVRSNLTAARLRAVSRRGVLRPADEEELLRRAIRELDIRLPDGGTPIEHLSGGNQQKVLLGRWLSVLPTVLLLDEPTTGVDVGAREEIYRQVRLLADQGVGVLLISSDTAEVLRVSDRVLVMYKGRVHDVGSLPNRHVLVSAATGGIAA
jgi:ABC-type sugar transport system ATPase subunit